MSGARPGGGSVHQCERKCDGEEAPTPLRGTARADGRGCCYEWSPTVIRKGGSSIVMSSEADVRCQGLAHRDIGTQLINQRTPGYELPGPERRCFLRCTIKQYRG